MKMLTEFYKLLYTQVKRDMNAAACSVKEGKRFQFWYKGPKNSK